MKELGSQFHLLIITLMSVAGLVNAATSSSETEKFDLKKAIAFAIENSPTFDSIKRQLSIAQLDEKSAEAKLLPSLDLTATHGILDTSPRSTTSPWSSEFNLGITESLYDNGEFIKINSLSHEGVITFTPSKYYSASK
jgi:outer membrane protein TolC